jgi:hypothetical protein
VENVQIMDERFFVKTLKIMTEDDSEPGMTLPGMDNLLNWLKTSTDFFTAPASSSHHMSHTGGLLQHSINVYMALKDLYTRDEKLTRLIPFRSVVICGLLHDVCKTNTYVKDYKNVKDANGNWNKVPYFKHDPQLPLGHGSKSVILLQKFIQLEDAEIAAILYHMGAWDLSEYTKRDLNAAQDKWPLVRALQIADMTACLKEGCDKL